MQINISCQSISPNKMFQSYDQSSSFCCRGKTYNAMIIER